MLNLQSIKVIALIALLVGLSLTTYRAGYKAASTKYEVEKAAAAANVIEKIKEAQVTDQAVVENRKKADEVVTRTITKVQREIVKIPVRDCGFTVDERLSINAAYCASFPDAPSCLHDEVPTSSGTAPSK